MVTAADFNYIRNIIFSLVNFTFSGQITTEYHDGIRVSFDGSNAAIGCKDKTTLARGLFLLALHAKDGAFSLEEKAAFDRFTVHIDVSRNRVLKVASVKKYMEYMAALGFNSLTLYMEDVFHMEKYPRFGYMRGRYEIAELQEIDDYADSLGIEVFPTVQTLGHMEQYLRWNEAKVVKDTADCLLVGAEETYELIEEIFKTMRKAFRSDRISIGVDETHSLGTGFYFNKHGYRKKSDIIYDHLERVSALCEKYHYKPIMYSDMFFRLASPSDSPDEAAARIREEIEQRLSENMTLCHWDYYNSDKNIYDMRLAQHKSFNRPVMFLGSIWNWEGFMEDTVYTYQTSVPAMLSCIEQGIRDVGISIW